MRAAAVAALVGALLAPGRATACASCSCGDTTLTATGVERPYRNRVRLGIEERYGSLEVGDEHSWFLRSTLAASWSPLRRLTLAVTLPWVVSWVHEAGHSMETISGLGDLELAVRGVMFQERKFAPHHLLYGTGGLKFPTGYRVHDDAGYPYPEDDQPGSGSWDPFAGVTYAWFSGDLVSLYVSASYRYTTTGWRGYRRGSTLGGSTAVQLQPWTWGAFVLGADVIWEQPDTLSNGADVPNTGGVVMFLAPALLASPRQDLLVRLAVDVPAVVESYGQRSVGTQVMLSIAYDVR